MHLTNISLASGYLPYAWRHAVIVAVPKSGKPRTLVSSQRPISLLSSDGKVLECIVDAHVSDEAECIC